MPRERENSLTTIAWHHRRPSRCEHPGYFLCYLSFSDFGSVFYRIYDLEGVFKQDFVSSFIKWKGGELQMATNSLTLLPSKDGIYAPCPLIWVGSGTDHQNIAEVMLCQFPCSGLKRLTASASFLRILLLREATCHAVRGPELTKVGGR